MNKEEIEDFLHRNSPSSQLMGYSHYGSSLYGLNNFNSDLDLFVIIDTPVIVKEYKIPQVDITIMSVKIFMERLYNSDPRIIEMITSDKFQSTSKVIENYLRYFHINVLKYMMRGYHSIEKDVLKTMSGKGFEKPLKIALRQAILLERMNSSPQTFTSFFNEEESKIFYKKYEELLKKSKSIKDKDLLIDLIFSHARAYSS